MEISQTPFGPLNYFLENFGLTGLFLLLFLEESGIPLPIPGDIFILIAASQAKFGKVSFWSIIGVVFAATVSGSTILYFISQKLARPVVLKIAKFAKVDEKKLKKVSSWLIKRGGPAIVIGRLTPGFRIITSIAAGLLNFPYPVFIFYTGIAAVIWGIIYFSLGFFVGVGLIAILQVIGRYFITAVVIMIFLVLTGLLYFRRKKSELD